MPVKGKRPDYIAFGSAEHRALLGLTDPDITPERKAQLEKQLVEPKASAKKLPVTREHYAPDTRFGPGDEIIDGWTRRGR